MTLLTELPEDILDLIFLQCQPRDFVALCQTSKTFYQFKHDSLYWRTIASETFRLPISPLLRADGARWYYLYKRLKTQTRLFTWGQGLRGNLGRGIPIHRLPGRITRPRQFHLPVGPSFARTTSTWPTRTDLPPEIEVISDLQCGGWSTSILSSNGKVYVTGIINAMEGRHRGEATDRFTQLHYKSEDTTAIRQFSSGRFHILALTDEGNIISWDRINAPGLEIYSQSGRSFGGRPNRVVAGWGQSSAYVPERGLVVWVPPENTSRDSTQQEVEGAGVHVPEKYIPGTARYVDGNDHGVEVVAHVLLEGFIVWITSDSKVYACSLHIDKKTDTLATRPFEVPGYRTSARSPQDVQGQYNKFVVFTNTGEVLAGNTTYLEACARVAQAQPLPDGLETSAPSNSWPGVERLVKSRPADVPALQHNQVISLAFGDHHYHALHANGKIASFGHEPESCGALGLGDQVTGARLRALQVMPMNGDSNLVLNAAKRGRQIWFEPEKRDWLAALEGKIREPSDSSNSTDHAGDLRTVPPSFWDQWFATEQNQFLFSEWIEQEGSNWDEGPLYSEDTSHTHETKDYGAAQGDFHLDPYFAISATAAGWHSGALVLVDDEKAHETREKWLVADPRQTEPREAESMDTLQVSLEKMPGHFDPGPEQKDEEQSEHRPFVWQVEGFPRVELPDGSMSPGTGEARRWRREKPSLTELGLS